MPKNNINQHKPLMVKKYYSMLISGTFNILLTPLALMADPIIAGLFLGSDSVMGITLVSPLIFMVIFSGSIFSLGTPILYSETIGEFDKNKADRIFGFGLLMSIIIGVSLFVVTLLFGVSYLSSSHPVPAVLHEATLYLFWMRFSFPFIPVQFLIIEMVFFDGDEILSSTACIVEGVGHIILSTILCHYFGISGIGFSSFIFLLISLLILFTHYFKATSTLHPILNFSGVLMAKTLWYSIISASPNLFFSVSAAILNVFMGTYFGPEYLILVSVFLFVREIQMVFDGIGEAVSPIIGTYLGELCKPGVKRIYTLAEKDSIIEGVVFTIILFISASFIPEVLGIKDPYMFLLARSELRITALSSFFVSLMYLVTSYDILIERIYLGLFITALRDFLLPIPLAVVCGILFGVYGVFVGLMLGLVLAWFVTMAYLRLRYREDAPLFLERLSKEGNVLLYDMTIEPKNIIEIRNRIEKDLKACSYDNFTINRIMLLFEELFMFIHEQNPEKSVQGECILQLRDDYIRMITRDTGKKLDLTNPDLKVKSLRSYIISNISQNVSAKRQHLVSMSLNRNVFEVKCGLGRIFCLSK